nr:hypothetical protein [Thermoanaerobaculia bacterium]
MMGLTSGSLAVSRFTAAYRPDPDFESAEFREILPGSEVRESIGFVPFEIDAPYEVGTRRWAFRIRIDRLRPDPTTVKERFKQLVATELASGARFVGPRKKKELRALAEDEILTRTSPRSKILEAVLDGETLYLGTTARSVIGLALQQLRKIGIDARYKNPWIDAGLPELASDAVLAKDPGDSAYGCQFLKALVGDADFLVEPEAGRARLAVA